VESDKLMPRIIHAADIHLDSPLQGLGRLGDAGLATELRAATRRAYDNLVQLCIDEKAGLLVIAGDIYDGDWRSYETGEYFVRGLHRLRDSGIEVARVEVSQEGRVVVFAGKPGAVTAFDANPWDQVLDHAQDQERLT